MGIVSGTPNPIAIVVTDGVDPSIATNLKAIGDTARQSSDSLQVLTQSLANVGNSGVNGLASQLQAMSTSTLRLTTSTSKLSAAALEASKNVDALSTSYTKFNSVLTASLSVLQGYSAALASASTGAATFNAAQKNTVSGGGSMVSQMIAGSAALHTLEGNFQGNARAADRFLISVLGLGPALQIAFPIFGALALIGVLDIVGTKIKELFDAVHNRTAQAQAEALALLNSNQQLIKGEHGIGASVLNTLLGRKNAPDVQIVKPEDFIHDVELQKQLNDLQAQELLAGKQGLELQKAKEQVTQVEITNAQTVLTKLEGQRNAVQDLLSKKVDINASQGAKLLQQQTGIPAAPDFRPVIPVDSEQFKKLRADSDAYNQSIRSTTDEIAKLDLKLKLLQGAEPFKAKADEIKAAREQLKAFDEAMSLLEQKNKLATPQDKLALLQKERNASTTLPENIDPLDARIGVQTQAIERQKAALEELSKKYQDQVNDIGLVSDAQKTAAVQSKINIELMRLGIDTNSAAALKIKENAALTISQSVYQKELNKVYTEANQPLRTYTEGTRAIADLEKQGLITHAQALIAQNELNKTYQDAINPLTEYSHGLSDQVALFGHYGTELTVVTELQKVQNELRNKGKALTDLETAALTQFLTKLEQQKQLQAAVVNIYNQNKGAIDKLVISLAALNAAKSKGIITERQYDIELAKTKIALADQAIAMDRFTKGDVFTSVFGNFAKSYQGFAKGVITTWQNAFDTIANGAADALGRAIAYGENLGSALKDVARQALSELISGFIKLGIQWIINQTIAQAGNSKAIAEAIATGTAIAAAYAPAAAFTSLASFGGNAAPADAALGSTVAFAQLLSILHLNSGGVVPGLGNRDTVPALLTPGEGVLTQAAMRHIGASTLQAWNKGQFNTPSANGPSANGGKQQVQLNLIHDMNAVTVQYVTADTVRVIAKQESKTAVNNHAGDVVASHIANPNSNVSKSIALNTTARRNR